MALSPLRQYITSESERRVALASGDSAFESILGHVFLSGVEGQPDTTPLLRFRIPPASDSDPGQHVYVVPAGRPLSLFYRDTRYGNPYASVAGASFVPRFEDIVCHLYTVPASARTRLSRVFRPSLGRTELSTASDGDLQAQILASDVLRGVEGFVFSANDSGRVPIHGLVNNADVFYTMSPEDVPGPGYTPLDARSFTAYAPNTKRTPLCRFIHPATLDQALAVDPVAWRGLEASGYQLDGMIGFVDPALEPAPGLLSLFGLFDPARAAHLYTTSAAERRAAVEDSGYTDLGLVCYVHSEPVAGSVPLFRLRRANPRRRAMSLLPPMPGNLSGNWLLLGERSVEGISSRSPEQALVEAAERDDSGVRFEPGSPLLDRDLNLLGDLATGQVHEWIESYIGNAALVDGAHPSGGFAIGAAGDALASPAANDGDFTIEAGDVLAGGVRVTNSDATLTYRTQPRTASDPSLPPDLTAGEWVDIVYLDVWLEETPGHPNTADLDQLTTTLSRPTWRVELARWGRLPKPRRGHRYVPLAAIYRTRYTARPDLVTADHLVDLRPRLDLRPGAEVFAETGIKVDEDGKDQLATWGHWDGPPLMFLRLLFQTLTIAFLDGSGIRVNGRQTTPKIPRGKSVVVERGRPSIGMPRVTVGGRPMPVQTVLSPVDRDFPTRVVVDIDPALPLGRVRLAVADDLDEASTSVDIVAPTDDKGNREKPEILALSRQVATQGHTFDLTIEGTELDQANLVTFRLTASSEVPNETFTAIDRQSPTVAVVKAIRLTTPGAWELTLGTSPATSAPVIFLVEATKPS